jgi:hypothetical protein
MKVWLRGEKAGKAETFVDNLPGAPDNIRLGSDGHYWIALHVSVPATGSQLPASSIPSYYQQHLMTVLHFGVQNAAEVAMAGLHHALDLHEESGGLVPRAP